MNRYVKLTACITMMCALIQCRSSVDIVISKHANPEEIKKIAIFKLEKIGRYYHSGDKISDLLTHEFLKLGFDVVERSNIEKLIKEQKLSVSGFIDPREAVAIGKLAGADTIVTGTGELDEKNKDVLKYLIIKVISLKSGSVIITANLTKTMSIKDAIAELSESLNQSLKQRAAANKKEGN